MTSDADEIRLLRAEVDRLRDFILSNYIELDRRAYDYFVTIDSYVPRWIREGRPLTPREDPPA